jgi:hypothetical protein
MDGPAAVNRTLRSELTPAYGSCGRSSSPLASPGRPQRPAGESAPHHRYANRSTLPDRTAARSVQPVLPPRPEPTRAPSLALAITTNSFPLKHARQNANQPTRDEFSPAARRDKKQSAEPIGSRSLSPTSERGPRCCFHAEWGIHFSQVVGGSAVSRAAPARRLHGLNLVPDQQPPSDV